MKKVFMKSEQVQYDWFAVGNILIRGFVWTHLGTCIVCLLIGVQTPSVLGDGDQKIYAMATCDSIEIGMQTQSNCKKNKIVHNSRV